MCLYDIFVLKKQYQTFRFKFLDLHFYDDHVEYTSVKKTHSNLFLNIIFIAGVSFKTVYLPMICRKYNQWQTYKISKN